VARGEFSIIIAALGATLADGQDLGALAAGYVLFTALVGPVAAKYSDRLAARYTLSHPTGAVGTGPPTGGQPLT